MYVKYSFSAKRLLKRLWWVLLLAVTYAYVIHLLSDFVTMNIPPAIPGVLGTAISLLLGFKTNAAYSRWWEARKIWGGIVNDSRTFARQVTNHIPQGYQGHAEAVQRLVKLQVAFVYALRNSLRKSGTREDYCRYLNEDDQNEVEAKTNKANAILTQQQKALSQLHVQAAIDSIQLACMEKTLGRLCDSMGKSERIKNTIFPMQYSLFTRIAILIYAILFPFGVITEEALNVIFVTFVVMFFFLLIDSIGTYLENPFENRQSDIPLSAIARTIEIDLLELIADESVPEKLGPKSGVLM
jgi:putative membrane protein